MIQDLLIWPNDDVVMWTGVATGIYGSLPGRSIGTPVEVSILHLESGQYWRPNGEFGEAMSHTGSVVASDGHWRLSVSPPAGGTYRLVVVASASDGSAVSATTEFSVMGEDLISPFVNASAEDLVQASADSSTTPALPETAISDSFPILDAASRQFWDGRRGIGFSVDSQGQWLTQQRLESALQEVSSLGFDTIRTWGTNDYTGRILAAIDQMDLDLKVQAGIYITNGSNAEQLIDQALDVIQPYEQHILGLSLGNEQLADWNPSALQVSDVREHVQMFRERSDLLITYNFAGETLRPESSFWSQQGEALLQDLDYINVHSYAGFFDNRLNPEWTPQRQLEVLKTDEALFRSVLDGFNLNDTPLILGETGWQSGGYAEEVTNAINMETYFQNVDQYIASDAAVFDNMFYFNFSDESWKGPDDYWGLFTEGNELGLGNAKFDGSINSLLISAPATDSTLNLNLTLISDSGSARLLVDESTGLAYVQKGEDDPVVIQRNDDYWSDEVPVERGQAQLVAAAVDDLGRLRVLDRSQQWGDFGWILDDNGYFIGEEGPGDTTVASNEILFLKDLDGDQLIGTEEVSTDLEPIADQSPPPSPPETDSTLNLNLTLISDSGSARLLVDESTGLAYVQKGEDDPVVIQRNDDYWSDEVPVERGQAQLVAAAVDDLGRLRVLDRSQQWGDFGWILDDNGYFIGEEGPGDTTVASNEILFLKDLDGDQLIGTANESNASQPSPDQINPFDVTGFSQGEFLSTIAFSHRATADPIVAPGNANFMHAHDFFANTSTDENSTVSSLLAAGSTAAQPSNNLSTYWAPSLIDEGADGLGGEWSYITPKATSIAYYSVLSPNDPNQLVNMPTGLKMITGSARPMERQSRAQVFWNYIGESASYDHIPLGDEWRDLPLQAVLLFQDHWNGEQLDSSDHKSHLAFGAGSDEHPLLIPQLQLQIHYGRIDNNLHLVSSDYMNLPEEGSELNRRLREASEVDLSFRNDEAGFAPGWSMHADHIHLPWEETAPNGQQVDGFARREVDALQNTPLFAGIDGNAVRPIPTGISQPYSSDLAMLPILGTPGVDVLIGTDADDRMEALEGNDTLIGGLGGDHLVGGDGVDSFVFQSINDSTWVNPDEIIGFAADDRIDLSALNLAADVIQLEQMNPSSWMLSAIGTDLAVEIRTGQIGLEQILLT